jgi:hypothetical protein
MKHKFDLGCVTIKGEAAFALTWAGQDCESSIKTHAAGNWSEEDDSTNEQVLP